jgi:hypothetical protein
VEDGGWPALAATSSARLKSVEFEQALALAGDYFYFYGSNGESNYN